MVSDEPISQTQVCQKALIKIKNRKPVEQPIFLPPTLTIEDCVARPPSPRAEQDQTYPAGAWNFQNIFNKEDTTQIQPPAVTGKQIDFRKFVERNEAP